MDEWLKTGRRGFLQTVALTGGIGAQAQTPLPQVEAEPKPAAPRPSVAAMSCRRTYSGRKLAMVAFPLGGIGTGSISLGGRGQLRDWEIFNRPDKSRSPEFAFPAIWVQAGSRKPIAKVLESRLIPPYESARGLGPDNVPGLPRLESATFTGEFPLAHVAFRDSRLPVKVCLEAFSPFIPLDPEESGLPVAVLRYRVQNPGKEGATVAIGFSIDNEFRQGNAGLSGFAGNRSAFWVLRFMLVGGRQWTGEPPHRLDECKVVGQSDALLGRLPPGWRTRVRCTYPEAHRIVVLETPDRRGKRGIVHVPVELAVPESDGGVVGLERARRRGGHESWQSLLHPLRQCLGGGRICGRKAA